jgi:hypothetical protein
MASLTPKHVLAFLVVHDCSRLQLLCLQPICDSNSLGFRRAGLDRLLLLLLRFLLRSHLRLLLCHGLFSQPLNVFLHRNAVLLCLGCELLLDLANLLWRGLLAVGSLDVDGQSLRGRGTILRWLALRWWPVDAHCVRVCGVEIHR